MSVWTLDATARMHRNHWNSNFCSMYWTFNLWIIQIKHIIVFILLFLLETVFSRSIDVGVVSVWRFSFDVYTKQTKNKIKQSINALVCFITMLCSNSYALQVVWCVWWSAFFHIKIQENLISRWTFKIIRNSYISLCMSWIIRVALN